MLSKRSWKIAPVVLGALVLGLIAPSGRVRADLAVSGGTAFTVTDDGGTNVSNPDGSVAGKGIPTKLGGWSSDTVGVIAGSLTLTQDAVVNFTYFGKGDSAFLNSFWVDSGAGYKELFGPGVAGSYSQGLTDALSLKAGVIKFEFITGSGTPVTIKNGDNPDPNNSPSYFVGANTGLPAGKSFYVGLSDTARPDADYQDLAVLITVPEPGPTALLGVLACLSGGAMMLKSRYRKADRV